MQFLCQGCARILPENTLTYHLKLELFASPDALSFDEKDMEDDLHAQWNALVRTMEQMSDHEVAEASDQVYESYEFILCPSCRKLWHERLKDICNQFGPAPNADSTFEELP